jgi:capsular polysaccharide transport system permease protein
MSTAAAAPPAPRKRSSWDIQRAVLFALVLREMKQRVGGQWIGAVWTVLEPLAHMMVVVTILGFVRGQLMPGIEYPVFLVTGLIPYFFFQHLTIRLMDGIEANRGVYSYRQVKPIDALVSRAIVEALMNLVVYTLTLGILAWLGFHVLPALPLELIGVHLLIGYFGLSMGILAAVVAHGRPRTRSFIRISFMPLYFLSGVIFPVDRLPQPYLDWLLWNPMLHLVELSRHSFIAQYIPAPGVNLLYPLGFALAVSALGLSLYRIERLRLVSSS